MRNQGTRITLLLVSTLILATTALAGDERKAHRMAIIQGVSIAQDAVTIQLADGESLRVPAVGLQVTAPKKSPEERQAIRASQSRTALKGGQGPRSAAERRATREAQRGHRGSRIEPSDLMKMIESGGPLPVVMKIDYSPDGEIRRVRARAYDSAEQAEAAMRRREQADDGSRKRLIGNPRN